MGPVTLILLLVKFSGLNLEGKLDTLIASARVRASGVDHCLLSKVEDHLRALDIGN